MKCKTIESSDLDLANLQVDFYKEKYVVVKVDYTWDSVSEMHRFDIYYVDRDLWR